jgi:hypothetical protein
MNTRILQTTYKDVPAVAISDGRLRALFLPGHGGKMASLVWEASGREFLVQAQGSAYRPLAYDGDYVASECSGFDDLFPTIDRFRYDRFPWEGAEMPDHGEVCGLPWDYIEEADGEGEGFRLCVDGVRFPYRLEKRVHFTETGALRIAYELTNRSAFDLDCLWAAHIMLGSEEGAELVLPYTTGAETVCVFSQDEGLGRFGDTLAWPVCRRADGGVQRLDRAAAARPDGNSYKYYFKEPMPEGWFAYRYPSDGLEVRGRLSTESVPYFGVWMNEGSFKGLHNIGIEPCTGTFDRPDAARKAGQASVLKARDTLHWFLELQVGPYK